MGNKHGGRIQQPPLANSLIMAVIQSLQVSHHAVDTAEGVKTILEGACTAVQMDFVTCLIIDAQVYLLLLLLLLC